MRLRRLQGDSDIDSVDRGAEREIVDVGLELGAALHVSWSCYADEEEAGGQCKSRVLRLRAFAEAGKIDPIAYAGNQPLPPEPIASDRLPDFGHEHRKTDAGER